MGVLHVTHICKDGRLWIRIREFWSEMGVLAGSGCFSGVRVFWLDPDLVFKRRSDPDLGLKFWSNPDPIFLEGRSE